MSTVQQCGMDGSFCLNFSDLNSRLPEANVCSLIGNKPNGLFPGADLISDFSQIRLLPTASSNVPLTGDAGSFSKSCPNPPLQANLYAGCMTAPCMNTGRTDKRTGLPLVSCTCPTYNGPNQVGNPQIQGKSCSPTPFVGLPRSPTLQSDVALERDAHVDFFCVTLESPLCRISKLARKCSQAIEYKLVIRIHLSHNGLDAILGTLALKPDIQDIQVIHKSAILYIQVCTTCVVHSMQVWREPTTAATTAELSKNGFRSTNWTQTEASDTSPSPQGDILPGGRRRRKGVGHGSV